MQTNAVTPGGVLRPPATGKGRRMCAASKRWRGARIAIWVALAWLSLGRVSEAADGQEIVDRVSRLFVSQSSIATVDMEIAKEDSRRTILMQLWTLGQRYVLVRIRQPQEDAGTAILKIDSQAWMYLPKARRTVGMPASMMMTSWMGSDFTLNDLVNQSRLSNDYTIATSFEGNRGGLAITEYTLTPKPTAAVVWGKLILEVRQDNEMPIRQRYYDESGTLVREMSFFDYRWVNRRLIPTRLVMRPLDRAGEQTTITYQSITLDPPMSEETFSLGNLRQ
jgi:outer membrane lipoprotein-sorting protein